LHLSLNVMSLGGLALATGMVVDDSIVVLENIARLREKGVSILEAAVRGTAEVGMAVTASTLTTVAVFFPLVFVQGVAGQLFRDQALTITFAMLISLVVAMSLIPMLASLKGRSPLAYKDEPSRGRAPLPSNRVARGLVRAGRAVGDFVFQTTPRAVGVAIVSGSRGGGTGTGRLLRLVGRVVTWPYERAAAYYHRSLPGALAHPWRVLGFAAAALVATLTLVPSLGLDLIPQLAQGRFDMTVTMPPGTPLAETDKVVNDIASRHAKDPGVESIYGVAGTGTRLDANPTESGENIARLSIALKDGGSKAIEAAEIDRLRAGMQRADASVKFSRPALFSFSAPLEVEIRGYDLDAVGLNRALASPTLPAWQVVTGVLAACGMGGMQIDRWMRVYHDLATPVELAASVTHITRDGDADAPDGGKNGPLVEALIASGLYWTGEPHGGGLQALTSSLRPPSPMPADWACWEHRPIPQPA